MNKAFVRELDDNAPLHCPRCGSLGTLVRRITMAAYLLPEAVAQLADTAFFCAFPRCEVVYFDAFERLVTSDQLTRRIYPKDPSAPICGCFGLTLDDIEQDIAEKTVRRVKEVVQKAKSPDAQCETCSPSGTSCVAEVQRIYMRLSQQDAS